MSASLNVLRRPSPLGVTLESAKTALGVSGSSNDSAIRGLIVAATSRVEGILRRTLRRGYYREFSVSDPGNTDILLTCAPVSPISVTSSDQAVAILEVEQEAGIITVEGGFAVSTPGRLEPGPAVVPYAVVYWGGWWLDEFPAADGVRIESFELAADAAVGATELVFNAGGLETGVLLAGMTLSIGEELVIASACTRVGDVLTATVVGNSSAHDAGTLAYHVDEELPAAIQAEILSLVAASWATNPASGGGGVVDPSIASVSGDGYSTSYRDPQAVDAGILSRLRYWVRR